ncbi:hypothetical protein WN51_11500 [Melipona quadrifasciata]|uniref:Uncharacterized protein n=1 Tax=Melipona quadrifasciata TaxID=166423 RepID=A0A0M9ABQ9_9HYME|nr:hypothetical protein WN51_11500 [Melipona quadrifasciata]
MHLRKAKCSYHQDAKHEKEYAIIKRNNNIKSSFQISELIPHKFRVSRMANPFVCMIP